MMEVDNPFLALFESKEEVSVREKYALKQREEISVLLTRIFLFTASGWLATVNARKKHTVNECCTSTCIITKVIVITVIHHNLVIELLFA